ncbi:MAG TPA: choice-of-anchor tandem repeat GloVer-containing protein [Candidatus Sulfotelmatobacter sp.]
MSRSLCCRLLLAIFLAMTFCSATAATENVIHTFRPLNYGGNSTAGLISDSAGNLYGTASVGGTLGSGVVFELSPATGGAWTETVLHNFAGGADGGRPLSALVMDQAGNLFGTTYLGGNVKGQCGAQGCGAIFELSRTSNGTWSKKTIYNFQGSFDGVNPQGTLTLDQSGNLYGTTTAGGGIACGYSYCGTVFELSPTTGGTWNKTTLHAFTGPTDGSRPTAGVILDMAGNLYGTTTWGGLNAINCSSGCGIVFQLTHSPSGTWTENILYSFPGGIDGASPVSELTLDSAGNLYGTAPPAVFKLSLSNGVWIATTIQTFTDTSALAPTGKLIFDSMGNLYGTTSGGGTSCPQQACGTVFELSPNGNNWTANILYTFGSNFSGAFDGVQPQSGVILDAAGNLYGTTTYGAGANCTNIGCGTVFKLSPSAGGWSETLIDTFPGTDPAYPNSALISDSAGNLYGTSARGGLYGWGSVFKMTLTNGQWVTGTLHSFTGLDDGAYPVGLSVDAQGNLYGTAYSGGQSTNPGGGCGVVFALKPRSDGVWDETVLHHFGYPKDGCSPSGSPIFDVSGNLFGTTTSGGDKRCPINGDNGCGTVFELSPNSNGEWAETLIHLFPSQQGDGQQPDGGLVHDAHGNLYGTTQYGGPDMCYGNIGCGTVFELSPQGKGVWTESAVYNFAGTKSAGYAPTGLTIDDAGNLYGTTLAGGYSTVACGTVFELSPAGGTWNASVLYTFTGKMDGCSPSAGVTLDPAGNVYGVTYLTGGSVSCGSVFELSLGTGNWSLNVLHDFGGGSDGCDPGASLSLGANGHIYGTTLTGGSKITIPDYYPEMGTGTVFEVTP